MLKNFILKNMLVIIGYIILLVTILKKSDSLITIVVGFFVCIGGIGSLIFNFIKEQKK